MVALMNHKLLYAIVELVVGRKEILGCRNGGIVGRNGINKGGKRGINTV